jgi:hypothetical protein
MRERFVFSKFSLHFCVVQIMNKSLLYVTIYLLLIIPKLYSQSSEQQFKATLVAGASLPVGNFGRVPQDSGATQSAAKPGPSVAFSLSYEFKKSLFGLEILAGWQQNNVNNAALEQSLKDFLPTGSQVFVKSDNWHIWKFLAGPTIELPLKQNGNTNLDLGILAGVLKTTIPGYEFGIASPDRSQVAFVSYAPVSIPLAFCYQLNAGVNYRINRSLYLNGVLSFMHANPVHNYTLYLDPPYFTMPVKVSQSYPISSLNVMMGISYKL